MRYLLDVNALVSLGVIEHQFHNRVSGWIDRVKGTSGIELLTCSITELGFVRILAQNMSYGFTVPTARALLLQMKAQHSTPFRFVSDAHDVSYLPAWVKSPKQLTDGHLLRLARRHDAELATLDRKIPGALLVPETWNET